NSTSDFFIGAPPESRVERVNYTELTSERRSVRVRFLPAQRGPQMLVVMEAGARPEQVEAVVRHIEKLGLKAHPIPGAHRTAIGVTGPQGVADPTIVETFPGGHKFIRVSNPYKLVSREAKPDDTIVSVGGVDVGGNGIVVVGGPCAVESLE